VASNKFSQEKLIRVLRLLGTDTLSSTILLRFTLTNVLSSIQYFRAANLEMESNHLSNTDNV